MRIPAKRVLKKRDVYIAGRINFALNDGGVGILMLGAGHCPEKHLEKDIEVITLADTSIIEKKLEEAAGEAMRKALQ